MKNLRNIIAIVILAFSMQSMAQVTVAWTGQNGNIVATSAAGGVAFGNYQSGNITLQGGAQNTIAGVLTSLPEVTNTLESFSVYPNPTNGLVFFDFPEKVTVQVYSLQGQLVHTQVAGQVDITNLSPGTYIIGAQGYKPSMIVKH